MWADDALCLRGRHSFIDLRGLRPHGRIPCVESKVIRLQNLSTRAMHAQCARAWRPLPPAAFRARGTHHRLNSLTSVVVMPRAQKLVSPVRR